MTRPYMRYGKRVTVRRGAARSRAAASPSGLGSDGQPLAGEQTTLTQADINAIVSAYADAAAAAERVGFDGVELHAAHGYLIDQFLWSVTNRRTDRYGGDSVARTRFAAEVVAAVRAAVSPTFPVLLRVSSLWKGEAYDAKIAENPHELERILTPLADAGVDIFHASTRTYWQPEFPSAELNLAGWIKKIAGGPAITVGSVGLDTDMVSSLAGIGKLSDRKVSRADISPLMERLERDEFDLVAVGRALLADPDWAQKIRTGRVDEILAFDRAALRTLA